MGKNVLNKIKILRPKIIKLSDGNVMRFLQKKEVGKKWKFGEAYFSKIKPRKNWRCNEAWSFFI